MKLKKKLIDLQLQRLLRSSESLKKMQRKNVLKQKLLKKPLKRLLD